MRSREILNIGMPIEVAIWLTGRETENQVAAWKKDCEDEVKHFSTTNNVVMGPPIFTEKKPGEDRVPQVPDHIHGPNVRMLVCEAKVIGERSVIIKTTGFVQDLDKKDLERLRQLTRGAYKKSQPRAPRLTDAQCDAIIEQIGPSSAAKAICAGVDTGAVN